jgi:hypothetical protein
MSAVSTLKLAADRQEYDTLVEGLEKTLDVPAIDRLDPSLEGF